MTDRAARALRQMRAAVAEVREGRVEQPAGLRFEGVRAYSVTRGEVRRPTPPPAPARNRPR